MFGRLVRIVVCVCAAAAMGAGAALPCRADTGVPAEVGAWTERVDQALIDHYEDPETAFDHSVLVVPPAVLAGLDGPARDLLSAKPQAAEESASGSSLSLTVGRLRGRVQQALVLELAEAVRQGRVADAQAWRAQINLPRGVSASEGALVLQNLPREADQRKQAARTLVREAITWQTSRVRQLLADAEHSAEHADLPMPDRLMDRLGEATTLADLPAPLREEAGLTSADLLDPAYLRRDVAAIHDLPWPDVAPRLAVFARQIETHLPSLLSEQEFAHHQRMLLKLVTIIPKEYSAGVRDGEVTVPLEYREAVSFTAQARQFTDELAPIWLAKDEAHLRGPLNQLEQKLSNADQLIAARRSPEELATVLNDARSLLEKSFQISAARHGNTADIVEEVMLETRGLLSQSLGAANAGHWAEAESLRLEAYTTYDPDLETRLMPRDPQLTTDIEHLLLDGLDQPGVKALLDRRVNGPELEAAYSRVSVALNKAGALLKSGVSPTAAAVTAGSIVLREGLEGLLVIVAILAGLRGDANRKKRYLVWIGVALSMVATLVTWVLSQTVITRLHYYGEFIEAITSILAIAILLLITNWLFHQIYWRQWVSTLKNQAEEGESAWQLVTVGFLIGYREGFESVLFLESLFMDVGGGPVSLGVAVGLSILVVLAVAALVAGLKLPYFKLLLGTAALIGVVLVTFVGTASRSMQTVGWLPVHQLVAASWPAWLGKWFGVYNSMETVGGQVGAALLVLGTWRVSRWRAKRAAVRRGEDYGVTPVVSVRHAG